MNAREMIEQEMAHYDSNGQLTLGCESIEQAAELVAERLLVERDEAQLTAATLAANYDAQERRAKAAEKRCEELELYIKAEDSKKQPGNCHECDDAAFKVIFNNTESERYRERLDRMVGKLATRVAQSEMCTGNDFSWYEHKYIPAEGCVDDAVAALKAIDAQCNADGYISDEQQRAGYILAMRLLQSDVVFDDDERAAIEFFVPQKRKE